MNASHNSRYVMLRCFCIGLFLYNESHALHLAFVLRSCCYDIDTCCIDACVPENICQLGNVLFQPVKGAGKQMPEIVGKDLAW